MYCTHCGKQIDESSKFCSYCGGKVANSNMGNATNEQVQRYAEKAREAAKGFTDDVKQVAKNKDTSNFFTKNKYHNVKIIAVVLIAVCLLTSLLGEDKGEKMAKNTVSATFSNCDIKSATKVTGNDEGQIYVVKFIFSSGDESSAVVLITDDNATLVDVYPKSEYSRMEVFIDLLKEQLE